MKTMKFYMVAFTAITLASCGNDAKEVEATTSAAREVTEVGTAEHYNVSSESGKINWVGFKTYAGSSHNGTIDIKDGAFKVKDGELVGGSFVIDMKTIHVIDLDGTEYYKKLKGHLESPDFFDVASYPTAAFEITGVKPVNDASDGATHEIEGNLTMRDTTNSITFPAVVDVTDSGVAFQTPEFSINRTNWKVMYNSSGISGVVKDDLIDDYIKLTVDLTAQN